MQVLADRCRLLDTKSRKFRSYDMAAIYADIADYVLVIRQGKPGTKAFQELAYAVQLVEEAPDMSHGSRQAGTVFLLAKIDSPIDDPDPFEVYECFIPARRGDSGICTCFGFRAAKVCKHTDALSSAMNGAHLIAIPAPAELVEI